MAAAAGLPWQHQHQQQHVAASNNLQCTAMLTMLTMTIINGLGILIIQGLAYSDSAHRQPTQVFNLPTIHPVDCAKPQPSSTTDSYCAMFIESPHPVATLPTHTHSRMHANAIGCGHQCKVAYYFLSALRVNAAALHCFTDVNVLSLAFYPDD